MSSVLLSICIPAYKRIEFLKRLLDSITIQHFRDFEVVVTDDSPTDDVEIVCEEYSKKFPLHYRRNKTALGTPENWNEAIRNATGQWIKLMHDDDWFASPVSLAMFAKTVEENPQSSFIYSAYQNMYAEDGQIEAVRISRFRKRKLEIDPVTLFSKNVIGPPSVTLVRNDGKEWYDRKTKWVVDIDFYIRVLKINKPVYIDSLLINVGINSEQVTRTTFRVPAVEIPENFYLLEKTGIHHLKNVLVYDAWWRIIRNLGIRTIDVIRSNGYNGIVHPLIKSMIGWQASFPRSVIKIGLFSKFLMFIHYLSHRQLFKK